MSDNIVSNSDTIVHEATTTDASEAFAPEDRAAAEAAVRKAITSEEAEPTADADPSLVYDPDAADNEEVQALESPPKGKDQSGTEPAEGTKTKLSRLLREREKANKLRSDARNEVQAEFQKLEAQRAQLAQQEQQIRQQAEWLKEMRSDPAKAIQALGFEPQDFMTRLAQEGTPEGELARWKEAESRKLLTMEQELQKLRAERAAELEASKTRELKSRQEQIVKSYLSEVSSEEKYPSVTTMYGDDKAELERLGHHYADLGREALGRAPTLAEVCEFFEEETAKKLARITGKKKQPVSGKSPQVKKSLPPNGVSRQSSERISAPVSEADDDPDLRREKAIAAVKAALKDADLNEID